jgi:hypothetical protein
MGVLIQNICRGSSWKTENMVGGYMDLREVISYDGTWTDQVKE